MITTLTISPIYRGFKPDTSVDKYEVTKAQWDDVYNWAITNGYSFDNAGSGKAVNHPVQTVSWFDVVKWCNARSEKEGRAQVYYTDAGFTQVYKVGQVLSPYMVGSAKGYRLPTDVEWEYAARGGVSGKRFSWGGDTIDHAKANYFGHPKSYAYDLGYARYDTRYSSGGNPYTSPVGSFEAGKNGYGLYDMEGNVWEWCWDSYPGSGSDRVLHGGGWNWDASYCRVAFRKNSNHFDAHFDLGFRAVLPPCQ